MKKDNTFDRILVIGSICRHENDGNGKLFIGVIKRREPRPAPCVICDDV
jgi:hypothetical protein